MGEMIRDMAFAIADSQYQLDQSSMRTAEMMGGLQSVFDRFGNQTFDDSRVFFGYEYMTIEQAQAYAIFDDGLTGGVSAQTIELKEVVDQIIERRAAQIEEDEGSPPSQEELNQEVIRVPTRLSLMELGFTPTFYQFVDTIIEVKIAIRMTRTREFSRTTSNATTEAEREGERGGSAGLSFGRPFGVKGSTTHKSSQTVQTTQVDATYSSKYSYSAEGASLLRTKLVPVPPPAILTERIRSFMEVEEETRRRRLDEILPSDDPSDGGE
ncbi:MAG: hypothetical protein EA422_02950 [Gemmatimonadales bacterium]|nr:MAG: hypothetical protein EA422_02950 [Gemmatimonadales bacterium]